MLLVFALGFSIQFPLRSAVVVVFTIDDDTIRTYAHAIVELQLFMVRIVERIITQSEKHRRGRQLAGQPWFDTISSGICTYTISLVVCPSLGDTFTHTYIHTDYDMCTFSSGDAIHVIT